MPVGGYAAVPTADPEDGGVYEKQHSRPGVLQRARATCCTWNCCCALVVAAVLFFVLRTWWRVHTGEPQAAHGLELWAGSWALAYSSGFQATYAISADGRVTVAAPSGGQGSGKLVADASRPPFTHALTGTYAGDKRELLRLAPDGQLLVEYYAGGVKTASAVGVRYHSGACGDDSWFRDEAGAGCRAWKGFDCSRAGRYGLTEAGVDRLRSSCRATCGLCAPERAAQRAELDRKDLEAAELLLLRAQAELRAARDAAGVSSAPAPALAPRVLPPPAVPAVAQPVAPPPARTCRAVEATGQCHHMLEFAADEFESAHDATHCMELCRGKPDCIRAQFAGGHCAGFLRDCDAQHATDGHSCFTTCDAEGVYDCH